MYFKKKKENIDKKVDRVNNMMEKNFFFFFYYQ
ncbi:MAG: hypothetical protein PWP28_1033 [Oceanotoga sp.]|jgi:hypothetical protein|nr:hypothetical protein [Oceanotoga sp.]